VTIHIREEEAADRFAIWRVNVEAFGRDAEAVLVNELREDGVHCISLVAEEAPLVVGHILFSPVDLTGDDSDVRLVGLGPMSVTPALQKRGVGSLLVTEGLKRCLAQGYDAAVVLGYPEYYPRFGFSPAITYNIRSEYVVPEEVFMIRELKKDSLAGVSGTVRYHEAFAEV